jgi:hypothetical protein
VLKDAAKRGGSRAGSAGGLPGQKAGYPWTAGISLVLVVLAWRRLLHEVDAERRTLSDEEWLDRQW